MTDGPTGQVVYLPPDVDPTPVVVALLSDWAEVVAERYTDTTEEMWVAWRWRITARWRIPR